jgi:cytochrome b561
MSTQGSEDSTDGMNDRLLKYSMLMMSLHWLTAVLVVAAYAVSEGQSHFHGTPPTLHAILGLAVLALTLPRLIARLTGEIPATIDTGNKWLARVARVGHLAIYVLLIAVPLTGWLTVSRLGLHVEWLGYNLPLLTAPVQGPSRNLGAVHQAAGNLLIVAAALHAAMALWHFFSIRDRTLQRMSPF